MLMPFQNYFVLNLIINGIPSIHKMKEVIYLTDEVLNLIINGIPSIHQYER